MPGKTYEAKLFFSAPQTIPSKHGYTGESQQTTNHSPNSLRTLRYVSSPSRARAHHHILVANRLRDPSEVEYDVVGPICESGDKLAEDRLLPTLREGDLLAILNAGAYGFSMSSEYNSRPRASEVLVFNGHHEVIRKRGVPDDLLSNQKDPSMDDARALFLT